MEIKAQKCTELLNEIATYKIDLPGKTDQKMIDYYKTKIQEIALSSDLPSLEKIQNELEHMLNFLKEDKIINSIKERINLFNTADFPTSLLTTGKGATLATKLLNVAIIDRVDIMGNSPTKTNEVKALEEAIKNADLHPKLPLFNKKPSSFYNDLKQLKNDLPSSATQTAEACSTDTTEPSRKDLGASTRECKIALKNIQADNQKDNNESENDTSHVKLTK